MVSEKALDLVIIGAGPAGVGAAIQARLYGLKVLVISKEEIGGRLRLARRVGNFPGPPSGHPKSGRYICTVLESWLRESRIPLRKATLVRVERKGKLYRMVSDGGRYPCSAAVIVATGVSPKALKFSGKGCERDRVFMNWRDVPGKRGACVAVIGGGEAAFDQACSLAEHGFEVVVLMRGERPRAYPGLASEAVRLGVKVVGNAQVRSLACDERGVVLSAANGRRYCCDYVLPAVGHKPQLPELDRAARASRGRGLWLAGDVREPLCRQAAVAFGDGVRCAVLAWEYLRRART